MSLNRVQMMQKINSMTTQSKVYSEEYEGFLRLFGAACMSGDTKATEDYRMKILDRIEKMLDNIATMLIRQLTESR
jgi:hypothetical protein